MAKVPLKQADLVRIAKAAKQSGVAMDVFLNGHTIRIYPNAEPPRIDAGVPESNEWDVEL